VSSDLLALVAGTVLAVGALAFVLQPLFFGVRQRVAGRRTAVPDADADDSPIVALREIEFDRVTGKLSDGDYAELRRAYTERALHDMRATPLLPPESTDPIEARVRAYRDAHRECVTCGIRPELDAIYCSNCGSYLDRVCPDCGTDITEPGATFCSTCGARLTRDRARIGV